MILKIKNRQQQLYFDVILGCVPNSMPASVGRVCQMCSPANPSLRILGPATWYWPLDAWPAPGAFSWCLAPASSGHSLHNCQAVLGQANLKNKFGSKSRPMLQCSIFKQFLKKKKNFSVPTWRPTLQSSLSLSLPSIVRFFFGSFRSLRERLTKNADHIKRRMWIDTLQRGDDFSFSLFWGQIWAAFSVVIKWHRTGVARNQEVLSAETVLPKGF